MLLMFEPLQFSAAPQEPPMLMAVPFGFAALISKLSPNTNAGVVAGFPIYAGAEIETAADADCEPLFCTSRPRYVELTPTVTVDAEAMADVVVNDVTGTVADADPMVDATYATTLLESAAVNSRFVPDVSCTGALSVTLVVGVFAAMPVASVAVVLTALATFGTTSSARPTG